MKSIKKFIREILQEEISYYLKNMKKDNCECPPSITMEDNNSSPVDLGADDYMDIDVSRLEEIKDLATIDGIINGHEISVVLDSASNKDLMPGFIADKLGLQKNKGVSYNIRGVTGKDKFSESVDATVFLGPVCKIETTFVIANNYSVPEIILGRSTLKKYNYDLFESKDHASITYNGKNFFIPIVPDKNRHKK